jgi:hypothetical protein
MRKRKARAHGYRREPGQIQPLAPRKSRESQPRPVGELLQIYLRELNRRRLR